MILAAAGIAGAVVAGAAEGAGTPGVAPGAASATGAGLTSSGLTAATPSVSILAMTSSATQVSPSFFSSWAITPATGAGTSSTTLSVSISTRISSISTDSPGRFFHCSRVASATDSDSCGHLTSMIAIFLSSIFFWLGRRAARYLVRTKPLSLPNAWSSNAFCCSWWRWA